MSWYQVRVAPHGLVVDLDTGLLPFLKCYWPKSPRPDEVFRTIIDGAVTRFLVPFSPDLIEMRQTSRALRVLLVNSFTGHDLEAENPELPLFIVDELLCQSGNNGSDIAAYISPRFARHLGRRTVEHDERVEACMRKAYAMLGFTDRNYPFICSYSADALLLVVPGEKTTLGERLWQGHLTRIGGHNIDFPWQQLALLRGLAALADKVS